MVSVRSLPTADLPRSLNQAPALLTRWRAGCRSTTTAASAHRSDASPWRQAYPGHRAVLHSQRTARAQARREGRAQRLPNVRHRGRRDGANDTLRPVAQPLAQGDRGAPSREAAHRRVAGVPGGHQQVQHADDLPAVGRRRSGWPSGPSSSRRSWGTICSASGWSGSPLLICAASTCRRG